jgi:hypothetical protein
MTFGTAAFILGILYLFVGNEGFRAFALGVLGLALGALCWAMVNGADKPQTIFYRPADHPAFALHAGMICPPDRHVWNGWCVK